MKEEEKGYQMQAVLMRVLTLQSLHAKERVSCQANTRCTILFREKFEALEQVEEKEHEKTGCNEDGRETHLEEPRLEVGPAAARKDARQREDVHTGNGERVMM